MSYFSECVIALRTSVNEKIDAFENNTPEVVRNYLKELGGIALYNAIFGNPLNHYEYQNLQRAIICHEIPEEDYRHTNFGWYIVCTEDARNRKNSREEFFKEKYKILFDLDTPASRKTFEQILAHDNDWSIATKELTLNANKTAKHILYEECGVRRYHFTW